MRRKSKTCNTETITDINIMTFNTTWKKNKKKVKLISYNVAYKNMQTVQRYSVHCVNTRVTWKVCDFGILADAQTVKPVNQWSLSTHNTVCEGHHLLHHVTHIYSTCQTLWTKGPAAEPQHPHHHLHVTLSAALVAALALTILVMVTNCSAMSSSTYSGTKMSKS